jgi:hypothetical protein
MCLCAKQDRTDTDTKAHAIRMKEFASWSQKTWKMKT